MRDERRAVILICIEGQDASGKATQSKKLAERLRCNRIAFPNYESPSGKVVEAHLQKKWRAFPRKPELFSEEWAKTLDPLVFQSVVTWGMLEHLSELRAGQARGNLVLDRYWPSGCVYGNADGLPADYLLNIFTQTFPTADLNILLDVSVQTSFKRRPERRDRYEVDAPLLDKVRNAYLRLWGDQKEGSRKGAIGRWVVLDGSGTEEEVFSQILHEVTRTRTMLAPT